MHPSELELPIRHRPVLDPGFVPAVLWNHSYQSLAAQDEGEWLSLALKRLDGTSFRQEVRLLPNEDRNAELTNYYVERLIKFLFWQKGGAEVHVGGRPEIAHHLKKVYSARGPRAFDHEFVGERLFGKPLEIIACQPDDVPATNEASVSLGRHLDGCRIGFDLGGSDRKAAAVIDGKVVFSEEIPWDPYFESDPRYHFEGICDSLRRAAAHLPRVDAIGGSAAGVYVNNEVRAGSLFRGVSDADFASKVRRIFFDVMAAEGWAAIPWEVVNDGEVTALAGSMSMDANAVLGVSMGTSEAAGYVDPSGNIKPWLNELAFAPIDYRENAPIDEWSGDHGCGVQYFSQQGVGRLVPLAGIDLPNEMPLPEKLVAVQELMAKGDERAAKIYDTVGVCFGYAIAHYASFYEIEHLLILGRVTSGEGGERIIARAEEVLGDEFPELAEKITLSVPNEKDKRHGQAVAAASLPEIGVTKSYD